ncbi:MAG: hypothetical protein KDA86_22720 [Planctomycetaceae bacterium]|nr:hypothetical protein [Planctomycetaceae bacterium]
MKLISRLALLLILSGCGELKTEKKPAPAAQAKPAPVEPQAENPNKPVHFKKRVAKLVNMKDAMAANPNLVQTKNRINATNYLTAVAQGYFAAASQIQMIQLEHTVKHMQALEDRWPTLEEFQKILDDNGIKLSHLYPYQMYGYDPETGELSILEDKAEKEAAKEAASW